MDLVLIGGLAGLFLLALVGDILGHKLLKIKRSFLEWVLVGSLTLGCGLFGFFGVREYLQSGQRNDSTHYLAYRYLMDGETSQALSVIQREGTDMGIHRQIIELLALCQDEDFISAYFLSSRLMAEGRLNEELQSSITRLNQMTARMLGLNEGEAAAQPQDLSGSDDASGTSPAGQEASQQISFEEEYQQRIEENRKLVEQEIDNCFDLLDLEDPDMYEDLYQIHKKVSAGQYDQLTLGDVMDVVEEHPENTEILKLAIKYTVAIRDYEEAVELAEKLLNKETTAENYIILTDVITQGVMDGYSITPEDDKEKEALLEKAESLEKRAAKQEDEASRARLLNKANEIYQQASQLDIHRAINYLEAKKPLILDTSGLYDVQMAKLYLAVDERDTAKAIILDLMDDATVLSDDSPIKEPLVEVIDAYNQSEADKVSPLLPGAVRDLVRAESQDIISLDEATINGKLANYMTSTLKYSKIGIFISKIDTSQYPKITAYVNVNGEKDGAFGLVSEFEKKDFELIDTQYEITDFVIDKDKKNQQVNIAIVMDCSGSMSGQPLADAKIAAKSVINKMGSKDQKLSIVAYSSGANIVTSITDNKDVLINGVNSLASGGGTNIPSGIEAGISSLAGSRGSKAIILLTDGQDGNSGAMSQAIEQALQNNVVIFTVGLGDVNNEYLSGIASLTGGKYIRASNSTELEDIYITLQKYIVNNYCMKYTVKANPDVDPRNLMVSIPEYNASGDRDYSLTDETPEEGDQASGIEKVDPNALIISGVTPNGLAVADVSKGRTITVTGMGFAEGIKISVGNVPLTDVKLVDNVTATGVLKGNLTAGTYPVKVSLADGRVAIKKDGVLIFRAGTTTKVRIGATTITADSIGQTGDNTFVAMGNVLINGFIHCDAPLTITATDLPDNFDINAKDMVYLGQSGVLLGDGKLYISYGEVSTGSKAKQTFARLALGGKDYVVQKGEFRIGIDGTKTDFDRSLFNFNMQIPFLFSVEVAQMRLYADRIQVTIDELNPVDIIDSIKDGIGDNPLTNRKEKTAADAAKKIEKRADAFKFKPREAIGGSLDIALTADDIKFGIVLKLEAKNSIQFGSFGLNEAELKINSLDPDNEYWKLSGAIDFSKIVKGFGGTGISGLEGHIASYYWCFDEIKVTANLYPGIPIYNVVYIDSLGLNLDGASTLFLNWGLIPESAKKVMFATDILKTIKPEDVVLSGIVGADANLFKTFKLKVPEDFTEWGKLGEIDGKISYNFSETQFSIEADLTLLGQEMANAAISFGKKGLDISAGVKAELSLLGCEVGGGIDFGLEATLEALALSLGIDGHLDCGFLNVHKKGDCGLKFIAEFDGSYYAVELSYNHEVKKFWYDNTGKPFFWDRFHTAVYYD